MVNGGTEIQTKEYGSEPTFSIYNISSNLFGGLGVLGSTTHYILVLEGKPGYIAEL